MYKRQNLGSSIGVSRAGDRAQLMEALQLAFELDRRVLVEQGLANPREVNCAVMGFGEEVTPSVVEQPVREDDLEPVSYTHLRAHETPAHLVCRLLLEKKKKQNTMNLLIYPIPA